MYFTREPIVETVITSKEGYKLCLRNSKGAGQEEYFVDAVEVISFGKNCFYRSLEKIKNFLLPISDYEIVEVREAKMVLKTPQVEKGIKIGGGREAPKRQQPQPQPQPQAKEEEKTEETASTTMSEEDRKGGDKSGDKKRDRRRFRKRKERDEEPLSEEALAIREEKMATLIPPPTTLISETISRYKDLPNFAGAFFEREEKEMEESHVALEQEPAPEEENFNLKEEYKDEI